MAAHVKQSWNVGHRVLLRWERPGRVLSVLPAGQKNRKEDADEGGGYA